jgi:hypothetical protein
MYLPTSKKSGTMHPDFGAFVNDHLPDAIAATFENRATSYHIVQHAEWS